MQEHILEVLESNQFCLCLILNVFENDIKYPINANLTVSVINEEFSAKAEMDIDIKEFAEFSNKLMDVYNTLKGEATIREPFGHKKFISFIADRSGYITVKGYLCDDSRNNELRFEATFDQTYLRSFANELAANYSKYKVLQ